MIEDAERGNAIEVFFSYSHKDKVLRDELEKHLSVLKRTGVITTWYDRKIDAGQKWANQIDEHLNTAQVVLLLISPDVLASDYCYDVEAGRAMERFRGGDAHVITVILRPVDWEGTPFSERQCLPTDAKPVTSWSNHDEEGRSFRYAPLMPLMSGRFGVAFHCSGKTDMDYNTDKVDEAAVLALSLPDVT